MKKKKRKNVRLNVIYRYVYPPTLQLYEALHSTRRRWGLSPRKHKIENGWTIKYFFKLTFLKFCRIFFESFEQKTL